jgi:hypothetical protein
MKWHGIRVHETDSNGSSTDAVRDHPTSPGPAPSTPSTSASGSGGFIMGAVNSAIELVKNPLNFMNANKDTPSTTNGIMINYVAVLAAIPFIATLIGDLWYYDLYLPANFVGSFVAYAFVSAILVYILSILAVYVIAIVIRSLASSFNSSADQTKSLKLAAYIYTPVFLIGILDIIPPLEFITILGVLYGLYILYLGLPVMVGTPKERVVTYLVAVVIATLIVYVIVGYIVGAIDGAIFRASFGYF